MPVNIAAAAASTTRNTRAQYGKARRKDRYIDDPDEEAGLLQAEADDGSEDGDELPREGGRRLQKPQVH